MTAAVYNLIIEQGATFQLQATWKDPLGVAINLTGYTARMMVRRAYSDAVPLLTFTTENGGITLGGVAGTIAVTGSATLTAGIPARPGVYDLEVVSGGGVVTRLLAGHVTVTPEATK